MSGQYGEFPPLSEAEEGSLFHVGGLHVLCLAPEEKDRFLDTLKGEYGEEARQAEIDRAEEGGYVSPEKEAQFEMTDEKVNGLKSDAENWHGELSEDQQNAVELHTNRDINYLINDHLYNGAEVPREIIDIANDLDAALQEASLSEDVTLYHGINPDTLNKVSDIWMTVDSEFSAKGFLSTTYDENVALDYAKKSAAEDDEIVMVEIFAPKGIQAAAIEDYSLSPEDKEILINRGTTFKVIDKQRDGNIMWLRWEVISS